VGERGGLVRRRTQHLGARALLIDPRILILDEATSSVGPETEKSRRRSTLVTRRFFIAHRLSTLQWADLVVLDRGRSSRWAVTMN
jgi:ABC-type multidrug transport system fused ATPase/permease subunit